MGLLQDAKLDHLYEQDIAGLNPLLNAMSQRGMPVDQKRRAAVSLELSTKRHQLWTAMQELVPRGARREKVYKRAPKLLTAEAEERPGVEMVWSCMACGQTRVTKSHPCVKRGAQRQRVSFWTTVWALPLPFTPSNDQMKRYCKFKGYTLPTRSNPDKPGIPLPTANEAALRRLALRHETDPLFALILKYRACDKILSTYTGRPSDEK
mgnify:CR=1 FL=1